jgi:beta-phosphoglucomutase-like phosphatase (HAD superfamily)
MQRLGINANNTIAIEDSLNGIISAKGAGIKCIKYKENHIGNYHGMADMVITSFYNVSLQSIRNNLGL